MPKPSPALRTPLSTPDRPTLRELTWQETAAAQCQVLARWQALQRGMTRAAWNWGVRHRWQSPHPGIAVLHTGVYTEAQLRWVARLCMGADGHLSGPAALQAFGVRRLRLTVLDVVVPRAQHLAEATLSTGQTVRAHRLVVPESWKTKRSGLPLITAPVATVHAYDWAVSERAGELQLLSSLQEKVVAVPTLRNAAVEVPRLRRRAQLVTVLDDAELGATALSELDYLRFCRRHGVPEPDDMQVKVRANGTKYLDARYRRQRISLELDGSQHLWPEIAGADNMRTLEVLVASAPGERIVRISRFNLRHDELRLAPLLRELLR